MSNAVPALPPTRRARPRARRLLPLALGLLLVACKDDPVRVTDDVAGTWTALGPQGTRQYLRIASDEIEVFSEVFSEDLLADCFNRALYEIVEIDGDVFRLSNQDTEFSISLRRDGEQLVVTVSNVAIDYSRTTVDPSTLPLCPGPTPDVPCADLPPLTIPGTVSGSLTASDGENADGSRFDLHRVQVDTPLDLVLVMRSGEVDSYLILFDEVGGVIAENDDASSLTLDARIAPTLQPGCYILMATSAETADLGEYRIESSIP